MTVSQGREERMRGSFVDPWQEIPSEAFGGHDPLRVDLR